MRLIRTLALTLAAGRLAAQEPPPAPPAPPPPPPDTAAVRVEPIVVTATREARSLFETPAAVTTVGAAALRRGAGIGLDEGLRLAPGVLAQTRYGGTDIRLAIRGFGARGAGDRSNSGTSRGVRVLVDGVPETEPDGRTSFDLVDLSTVHGIEVVRSNSSALWGNAAGGVVNLTTVPAEGPDFWEARAMAGSHRLLRQVARGAVRLGSGRLFGAATHTEQDGWREHSGARRTLASLGLVAHPDQRSTLRVSASGADNFFRIPGPLTPAEAAANPRQANATYASRDERRHNRLGKLAVAYERSHPRGAFHADLFVGPKFLQRSERGTFRDFTRYHVGGSVRARRALGGGRSAVAAGADVAYQDGAILFYNLTGAGGRGDTLRTDKREGARNLGFFAQAEWAAGSRWRITAGARWDEIAYYVEDHLNPDLAATKRFRGLTPKLGVTLRLGPAHTLYASLGGGVEAPAGNETDPADTDGLDTVTAINPLLDPIRSRTLEVGMRRAWLGRGLVQLVSYEAAAYRTTVTNEMVPYRGGRFYFSAGRVQRSGIELAASAHARGGIVLEAAVTVSRNRYVSYVVDSVHYGVSGAAADYGGNRVVGVPSFFAAGNIAWTRPGGAPLTMRLTTQSVGRYYADDANSIAVPAYTTLGASLAVEEPVLRRGSVGLTAAVSVANLANRRYIGSAFLNPDLVAGQPAAFEPGSPRSLLVSLTLARAAKDASAAP